MSKLKNQLLKKKAYNYGLIGEYITIFYLQIKFYQIIKHRFKCNLGEIDIIAKKNHKIIFIEVKSRKNKQAAGEIIKSAQLKRIINAAQFFLHVNNKYINYEQRFDIVIVNNMFIDRKSVV